MAEEMLTTLEVIEAMKAAQSEKKPLSIVRVGDGENICLAQQKVWPLKKVLATRWARLSRTTNWKGVRLPNLKLRDQLIVSIKEADIVGIPYEEDKEILAEQKYLLPLTKACFTHYNIEPAQVCHTFVNRHMIEYRDFWELLEGKRIVIISRWAGSFKQLIKKRYSTLDIDVVKTLRMDHYREIPKIVRRMETIQCDFVFISAGVNAVILAQRLATEQGKIALDFGKSAIFMLKGSRKVRPWQKGRESR